jgi:hypothetical protein
MGYVQHKKRKGLSLRPNYDLEDLDFRREINGECKSRFGFGDVLMLCERGSGHKGWHGFKTSELWVRWK